MHQKTPCSGQVLQIKTLLIEATLFFSNVRSQYWALRDITVSARVLWLNRLSCTVLQGLHRDILCGVENPKKSRLCCCGSLTCLAHIRWTVIKKSTLGAGRYKPKVWRFIAGIALVSLINTGIGQAVSTGPFFWLPGNVWYALHPASN